MSILELETWPANPDASAAPYSEQRPRSRVTLTGSEEEVSALRRALAAERLVSAELAHRNRNLLAVVSALVRRTLDEATDLATARERLADLTARLAEAHAAVVPRGPRDLAELARTTLAGFETGAGGQFAAAGPGVALTPEADRMLALVLFELATNAVKHGALRTAAGRVALRWSREPTGLRLVWRESGSEPPPEPTAERGGGALARRIGEMLDGAITLHREPEGLRVEIALADRHLRPPGSSRALVVEDSPLIAADLADMLVAAGMREATLAMSVEEARAALRGGGYDLVLLDVTLGEVCSDSLLPDLAGMTVVVVSGRDARDLPPAFAGLPLLPKPFQPGDVDEVVRRYAATASGQSMR